MSNNVRKINVRSPYFISALDKEDIIITPDEQDDPVLIREVFDEENNQDALTNQPENRELNVGCGSVHNQSLDIGVMTYKLDTEDRTGDVTINYEVEIPVKITMTWDTVSTTSNYVGDDDYEDELLDSGVTAPELSLSSGTATGTLTVNKSSASPSTVTVKVVAPLPTEKYKITFNCPVQDSSTEASEPSSGPSDVFEGAPAFYFTPPPLTNAYGFSQKYKIHVNGTLLADDIIYNSTNNELLYSITPSYIDESNFQTLQSDHYWINLWRGNAIRLFDKTTYLKQGFNTIEITGQNVLDGPHFTVIDSGFFYKGTQGFGGKGTRFALPSVAAFYDYNKSVINGANNVHAYQPAISALPSTGGLISDFGLGAVNVQPTTSGNTKWVFRWHTDGYFDKNYKVIDVNGVESKNILMPSNIL